jgi:Ion channel
VHRPSNETRLQLVGRIGDAYGLVLVLILATFVVTGVSEAQPREYAFFSYTTLTTTGYGNFVAAGTVG